MPHRINALATFMRTQSARMQQPDPFAIAALIKDSTTLPIPALGRSLHGHLIKVNLASSVAVEKALMHMYSRFRMMSDSCRVFDNMCSRDSASWNVLLSGYAHARLYREAMRSFYSMHTCSCFDIQPTVITLAIVLAACTRARELRSGRTVHGYSIKRGLNSDTLVGNALVSMYAKCDRIIADAITAFRAIRDKDIISWNSIMAGYCENGLYEEVIRILYEMISMGFNPNSATIVCVLPICALVENGNWYGKEVHCHVHRLALDVDVSVCNALVIHYSKTGNMERAELVFKRMKSRDIVTWNTVISGYAMNGFLTRAIDLYQEMTSGGIRPDSVTLITVLRVCAELLDLEEGRNIHYYILRHPILLKETSIGNALISFYGKCGEAESAMEVFRGMQHKDLISWNAMLNAYSDNEQWEKLIDVFDQMSTEKVRPDSITIVSLVQACAFLGVRRVKEAHGFSLRVGFITQTSVGNSILDAYAKCGDIDSVNKHFKNMAETNLITGNTMLSAHLTHCSLEDAEKIFSRMIEKDLTTWNVMLQVYMHNDCVDAAFNLFKEMQEKEIRPDKVSIMSVLAASGRLASAHLVKQCHGYTIRSSLSDLHLNGALLDTYSKSGSIEDASKLFRTSSRKDLVMFTAMVSGYAMHGMAKEAVITFNQMLQQDVKPDHVVFTALLSACSHAGLADEGWKHFKSIRDIYGMKPTMEHYACLVDLLARRGRIKEAYGLLKEMPYKANANMWGSLLGSCKTHGEVDIGKLAADHLFDVEDANIGNYVVMSNIYAAEGRWDGVEKVRRLIRSKDLTKPAGCSWIEIERQRHMFVAGDLSHPRRPDIYSLLGSLDQQLRVTASGEEFAVGI